MMCIRIVAVNGDYLLSLGIRPLRHASPPSRPRPTLRIGSVNGGLDERENLS